MNTDTDAPALMSISQIADLENLRIHQVVHVIRKLSIKPAYRFGNTDVFAAADIARIRTELARIAEAFAARRYVGEPAPAVAS